MKILQVVQFFSAKHGGSAMVPYEMSKHLHDAGHDVTVITTDFQMENDFIDSLDGVEVIPFHCQMNIGSLLISTSMKKYLKQNVNKFDIIHMHNYRTYQNIVVHKFAKKHGIPYVLQAHGSVLRIIEKKGLKYLFDTFFGYRILKDASKLIAVSNIEVKQYLQMGAPHDKIIIIPNGIEIDSFINLPKKGNFRKRYGISEKHIVLFLGRLHEIKGIDFLIKAYAELKKEVDDVVLVLAGPDDSYKAKAEMLINELNLTDQVKFTGYIGGADKLAAYVDADVLVYPSTFEIFGLVPFEAIMCSTPVIVTDGCGCGDLIQKMDGGWIVKFGDIPGLKDIIRNILEKSVDIDEKIKNGRDSIETKLAWSRVVQDYEMLYENALSV